jgi:hypothetical protein
LCCRRFGGDWNKMVAATVGEGLGCSLSAKAGVIFGLS